MNATGASSLDRCHARALDALRTARCAEGFWEGRLASSPLATAVACCALANEKEAGADLAAAHAYLKATQHADGGWGDTARSKSNLAATLLVLCADRMAPFLNDGARAKGEAWVEKAGGLRDGLKRVYGSDLTFQVPIRMTAAAAGMLPWREVDALPFELALAPRTLMGVLGLPVVSYALPALVCVGLSRHAQAPSWFLPARALRAAAAGRALDLARMMQPESGGYLEAVPITAFCLLGLKAAGRGDHDVARNARRFLRATQRSDGSWPVEVNLSVWNTTRAVEALAAGGAPAGEILGRTRAWLLAQQVTVPHPYTGTHPGGWGWNHLPGSVPDADDTSGALLALRALGVPASSDDLQAGARWLLVLQNRDGGWPTFCRGWQKLPFDKSAPDLTAHALRALNACGLGEHPAVAAGWRYLERQQRADGSFAPLWFGCEQAPDELNATYGTCHVLFALAGEKGHAPMRGRALAWLRGIQNADGGFGGCQGAPSTVEETGLALRALCGHGAAPDDAACARAANWLAERQRADGSWDPAPVGFYFAVLWYYEELYPLCYALGGLGAWRRRVSDGTKTGSDRRAAPVMLGHPAASAGGS
ncbi:MAG: squalene--hopene cyclase [Planctomycetes bacterium]|nr:squalene--hopene cyclase [Planctomycetota bacterium]